MDSYNNHPDLISAINKKIEKQSQFFGLAAIIVLGYSLYSLGNYLPNLIGDWATILMFPAYFTPFIYIPASAYYIKLMSKYCCKKNGHIFGNVFANKTGEWLVMCEVCGLYKLDEHSKLFDTLQLILKPLRDKYGHIPDQANKDRFLRGWIAGFIHSYAKKLYPNDFKLLRSRAIKMEFGNDYILDTKWINEDDVEYKKGMTLGVQVAKDNIDKAILSIGYYLNHIESNYKSYEEQISDLDMAIQRVDNFKADQNGMSRTPKSPILTDEDYKSLFTAMLGFNSPRD